ncbi:hypothetical protein AVEN_38443-1, partial [Araneus ventricosus]
FPVLPVEVTGRVSLRMAGGALLGAERPGHPLAVGLLGVRRLLASSTRLGGGNGHVADALPNDLPDGSQEGVPKLARAGKLRKRESKI